MNKRMYAGWVLGALASSFLWAGCQSQPSASSSAAQEIKIGVVKNVVVSLPLYEMQAEKQLEQAGYQVKWVDFESPTALSEAFLAGEVQVNSAIGLSTIADLTKKGVDPRILYVNGYASSAKIYSKTLHGVEELKGKKLGMPPASTETSQLATKLLAEQYHLQAPGDLRIMNTTSVAGATLLQKGDLDALLSYGSDAANIQQLGYQEIFDLSKSWESYAKNGHLVTSVTVVNGEFAASHAKFIQDFDQAYDHAVQTLLAHPDEVQAVSGQHYDLKKESLPYFNQLATVQLKGAGATPELFADAKQILTLFLNDKQAAAKADSYFIRE